MFFMSADLYLAQRAVFPVIAMVFAGINGAFDAVISIAFVHNNLLFYLFLNIIIPRKKNNIGGNILNQYLKK